jgi:hypothetical protein
MAESARMLSFDYKALYSFSGRLREDKSAAADGGFGFDFHLPNYQITHLPNSPAEYAALGRDRSRALGIGGITN